MFRRKKQSSPQHPAGCQCGSCDWGGFVTPDLVHPNVSGQSIPPMPPMVFQKPEIEELHVYTYAHWEIGEIVELKEVVDYDDDGRMWVVDRRRQEGGYGGFATPNYNYATPERWEYWLRPLDPLNDDQLGAALAGLTSLLFEDGDLLDVDARDDHNVTTG